MQTVFRIAFVLAVTTFFSAPVSGQMVQHLPTDATVVVTVASRNGGELLAQTLVELRLLANDPNFRDVLARPSVNDAEEACALKARRDPSGRIFDLAVCAKAWPEFGKAPLIASFERAYRPMVAKHGIAAFPNVDVSWFVYQQRQLPEQHGGVRRVFDTGKGTPAITDNVKRELCRPGVTFVAAAECDVKVRSRLGVYQADIYSPQVGYKVAVGGQMPLQTAINLREQLLKRVTVRKGLADDNFRVVVFPISPTANAESLGEPNGKPFSPISVFWSKYDSLPAVLDLTRGGGAPPTVLIFDGISSDRAVELQAWLEKLRQYRVPPESGPCTVQEAHDSHTQEAASLLFPKDVEALISPPAPPTKAALAETQAAHLIVGYFLSREQFTGRDYVAPDSKPWFAEGVFSESDPRIVGLAVFSNPVLGYSSVAKSIADQLQKDKSLLLVIAAATRNDPPEDTSRTRDYGITEPSNDPKELEDACKVGAWPSCLGRHPRILVVAPSQVFADGSTNIFEPDGYVLGASTVKLAAPGSGIPVLTPCIDASGAASTWQLKTVNGTSFAAPLVALLLSKIMQYRPDISELPEVAIWRLLATTEPLGVTADDQTKALIKVAFGEIRPGRALRGLTTAEEGSYGAAALYERDEYDKRKTSQAVVAPFLWSDQDWALKVTAPVSITSKAGIETQKRGFITISQVDADGLYPKPRTISFQRIVRIARRPNDLVDGRPVFDVYFVDWPDSNPALKFLVVKRRVWLGSPFDDPGQQGFCRVADPQPGEVNGTRATQSQPACLYVLRVGAKEFEALDLNKVDDIVFPVLHLKSNFVADIRPTDLERVTAVDSPWRAAFCKTKPRRDAWQYLLRKGLTKDLTILCKEV